MGKFSAEVKASIYGSDLDSDTYDRVQGIVERVGELLARDLVDELHDIGAKLEAKTREASDLERERDELSLQLDQARERIAELEARLAGRAT